MGNEQKILELKLQEVTTREMEVTDISTKDLSLKNNSTSKKIVFHVQDDNKRIFLISDAWVKINQYRKLVGLWCPPGLNGLSRYSNIGRMLKHYQLDALKSFIGSKVSVTSDKNGFLVIAACDLALKIHP